MLIKFIKKNKSLSIIILIGGVIRLLFLIYGAEIYFNRENIFIDADTWAWQNCVQNLIENGTFTVGGEEGQFSRMPGYPYFMGIFYLLFGENWNFAIVGIGWFQTFLDIFCIYLFYLLSFYIFNNKKISLISCILYACYPFIIVWNPVAYAEQLSTFFMLLSLVLFFKINNGYKQKKINLILSGIFLALAALTRPQLIPLFGVLGFILILQYHKSLKTLFIKGLYFSLPFVFVFGIWPLRNYINHDEIIITKNAKGFLNWQEDVIAFMQFTYAVKSEWDPQYTSIIKNNKTTYPLIAYSNKEDSIKLERAIYLAKNCGSGFSYKSGYWKDPIKKGEFNCNKEIAEIFNELRLKQIKKNPLNFYIWVPLKNLKKAIFKNQLYDNSNYARKIASMLFYLRTLLIIFGLIGVFIMLKNNYYIFAIASLLFFGTVYFTLCFGTSPFMRNIEIRYFLQADVLMLIPASFTIFKIIKLFNNKILVKINRW